MARNRSIALGIVLVVLIVTAGCSAAGGGGDAAPGVDQAASASGGGDGGGGDAGARMTATPMAEATPAGEGRDGGGGGGGAPARYANRKLIFTGHVQIEVDDFDAAKRNLTAAVRERGGFVSNSNERLHRVDNRTYTTGVLVVRVPKGNFSALMERAKAEGTVVNAGVESQDVTNQLIDINARLENLRAERARLRQLYRNASDTEDVLAVERRLSEVQGEIERLKARKVSLRRRVALSTITITIREPRPEPTVDIERWYDQPVIGAFLESVHGVVTTLRAIVVALALALPYLLVFGVPLIAAGYLGWRRRSDGR